MMLAHLLNPGSNENCSTQFCSHVFMADDPPARRIQQQYLVISDTVSAHVEHSRSEFKKPVLRFSLFEAEPGLYVVSQTMVY